MTVEIVGDDDQVKRRVTCRRCGKVLEYLPVDVEHRHYTDYGGVSDTEHSIRCPSCKAVVIVRDL